MTLSYVFPSPPRADMFDCDGGNAIVHCQSACAERAVAYEENVMRDQFRTVGGFATARLYEPNSVGMPNIFAARNIFQIVRDVVRWPAVNVVDLFVGWACPDERSRHQSMHLGLPIFAFGPQVNSLMSALASAQFQNLADVSRFPWTRASHATEARNFVPTFESRRWPPLFHQVSPV